MKHFHALGKATGEQTKRLLGYVKGIEWYWDKVIEEFERNYGNDESAAQHEESPIGSHLPADPPPRAHFERPEPNSSLHGQQPVPDYAPPRNAQRQQAPAAQTPRVEPNPIYQRQQQSHTTCGLTLEKQLNLHSQEMVEIMASSELRQFSFNQNSLILVLTNRNAPTLTFKSVPDLVLKLLRFLLPVPTLHQLVSSHARPTVKQKSRNDPNNKIFPTLIDT